MKRLYTTTLSLILIFGFFSGAKSQQIDDPVLLRWAALYSEGQLLELKENLIDEVRTAGKNQYYAAYVWCLVFNDDESAELETPVLERSCRLRNFRTERNFSGMIAAFPPDEVAGWQNVWDIRSYYWGLNGNGYDATYYTLLLDLLKNGSDDFNVAWSIALSLNRSERFRLELIEILENDTCCDPQISDFLRPLATYSNAGYHQRLATWHEVFGPETDDYVQSRFLANVYENIGNHAESARYWDSVMAIAPYGMAKMYAAYNHFKSGNENKAFGISEKHAENKARESGEDKHSLQAVYASMVYRDAGEWGKARKIITERLENGGTHHELYHELYTIENESGRHAEAANAARNAFERIPDHSGLTNLMGALLDDGDVSGAWELFNNHRGNPALISERLYWQAGNALERLEAPDIKLETYLESLEILPESGWMHRMTGNTYRELGNLNAAIKHLQQGIELRSDNIWAFHRLADAYKSYYGNDAYQEYKEQVVKPNRALQEAWSGLVQLDQLESTHIYGEAKSSNSDEYWPVSKLTLELINADAPYEMIYSVFDEIYDNISNYTIDDQIQFYIDYVETIRTQAQETRLPAEMLEFGLGLLESYQELGGSPARYHYNRFSLHQSTGDFETAAEALRQALNLDPDNEDLYLRSMFSDGITSQLGAEVFIRYYLYMQRNPWDGNRLAKMAHRHLRWGGSDLIAYILYERISKISPSHLSIDEYNSALEALGKRSASYRNTYLNKPDGLALSDRYISWYDNARLNAQKSEVDFQLEDDGSLKVFHANGIIAHYKDDMETGRPLFIRYGAASVEAEYDSRGELTKLRASSGSGISIKRDDQTNISSFTIIEKGIGSETWHLNYNDQNQIIRATDGNEHTLEIERDQNLEVLNTNPSQGFETYSKYSQAINKLSNLINLLGNQRYSAIPDLPYLDETFEELKETWINSYGDEEADAGIAYVEYLLENLTNHQDYASEAESVLYYMAENDEITITTEQQLTIIGLWHRFLSDTRPLGVNQKDWNIWQQQLIWLEQQSFNRSHMRHAEALKSKIRQNPISLLPAARWVPESSYLNPAFWSVHPVSELGHQHNLTVQPNTALIRKNGHVLIGTNHGLAIKRNGYWELLAFDDVRGRFSLNITPASTGNASSHILTLTEDGNENLWIGTRNGLLLLDDNYSQRPTRWRTTGDGIPHPEITEFFMGEQFLFAATAGGLLKIDPVTREIQIVSKQTVSEVNPALNRDHLPVVITQGDGIYLLNHENKLKKIHEGRAIRSAILTPDGNQLLFLEGNTLRLKPVNGELNESYIVPGQQDIVYTTNIKKLRYIPLPDSNDETAIAVLTDQGITAWHKSNFEYLPLSVQLKDRRVQVNDLVSFDKRVFAILQGSVLDFNPYNHTVFTGISAKDMLYAPEWEFTFASTGNRLVYFNEDDTEPAVFDYISSDLLSLTSEGGLLTNDGSQVVYYEPGKTTRTLLFDSENLAFLENEDTVQSPERFNSLLEASDGTIWATTPSTVFRLTYNDAYENIEEYQEQYELGNEPEPFKILDVYSMFKDPKELPARSDMISGVYETKDGDIWVVASAERHRDYKGVKLSGGLLRWTGDGFERISDDMGSEWFITSYTNIDQETALAGTLSGFSMHQGSRFRLLERLEDPSYSDLKNEMPMLWLGTEGALFGENTYVFGTAGGVILFNNGEWFYPSNLNRMLPEDVRFGERGGRHIHSIATSPNGIIYVSTDRGILVYDLGVNDDALLFQSNGMFDQAIRYQQRQQLIKESDVMMDLLMEDPELKDIVTEWKQEIHAIDQLEDRLTGNEKRGPMVELPESAGRQYHSEDTARPANLFQELEDRRRNYESLTRLLELEHHGAFQMLQLNPLDVAQLRHQLGKDEHIAVYIPTEEKLTIQLIDREEIRLLEVNISSEELKYLSMLVADNLAGRDFSGRRTITSNSNSDVPLVLTEEELNEYLVLMYESLLRPLEAYVGTEELLYIVPTGPLNYLPYNSLIRSTVPRLEFAVQRFTMGVLPSMYLLDLVLRHQPSSSGNAMIIGDPDGSLPGAREEAQNIYSLLSPSSPLLIGNQANHSAVIQYASDARFVHFATHGKLNPENPALSYLLLAGNQQLGVVDVMQLPLQNTDLVVLSACETGLGTSGLEYATLARAFSHAGAPSIIATLWEVPDEPSSLLVTAFYQNLNQGMNIFQALSSAQRNFIASNPRYQSPVNWAGYIPFGRP